MYVKQVCCTYEGMMLYFKQNNSMCKSRITGMNQNDSECKIDRICK